MKLENQVCTPEQSKRLCELLGWVDMDKAPETLFYHHYFSEWKVDQKGNFFWDDDAVERCPAFTVAELGVMLPEQYDSYRVPSGNFITESYEDCSIQQCGATEAQSRAAMLIYLLENYTDVLLEVNERLQNS